jgi:hypothetical protein
MTSTEIPFISRVNRPLSDRRIPFGRTPWRLSIIHLAGGAKVVNGHWVKNEAPAEWRTAFRADPRVAEMDGAADGAWLVACAPEDVEGLAVLARSIIPAEVHVGFRRGNR